MSGWTSVEKKPCIFGAIFKENGNLKNVHAYSSLIGTLSIYSLVRMPNGDIYGLGGINKQSKKRAVLLVKFHQDGSILWAKSLAGDQDLQVFSMCCLSYGCL